MRVVATFLTVCVSALALTPVAAQATPGCDTTTVAHRGYHRHHTENTMRAMRAAVRRGADVVEADLRRTKDGRLVVFHDRRLARTTNGRGFVHRRTGQQIRRLRTRDGQRVPYLAHFLQFLRRHPHVRGALELKGGTGKVLKRLDRRVTRLGLARRLTLASMSVRRVKQARRLIPRARQQLISLHRRQPRRVARYADRISLPVSRLTPGYVDRLHARRLRVQLRSSNRPRPGAWTRAMRMGVDAISTDALPELIGHCRSFNADA